MPNTNRVILANVSEPSTYSIRADLLIIEFPSVIEELFFVPRNLWKQIMNGIFMGLLFEQNEKS